MQQFITSSEACALLDRVLQTSQSLNQAIAKYCIPTIIDAPPPAPIPPTIEAESVVLPDPPKPVASAHVAPVLTIKLSDLVREGEYARQRRLQHQRQQRTQPKPRHKRQVRDVEVYYRRGFRMVS